MLIVLQIHDISFEIFFQSFMKFLPPAFNLKFYYDINGAWMY